MMVAKAKMTLWVSRLSSRIPCAIEDMRENEPTVHN